MRIAINVHSIGHYALNWNFTGRYHHSHRKGKEISYRNKCQIIQGVAEDTWLMTSSYKHGNLVPSDRNNGEAFKNLKGSYYVRNPRSMKASLKIVIHQIQPSIIITRIHQRAQTYYSHLLVLSHMHYVWFPEACLNLVDTYTSTMTNRGCRNASTNRELKIS